MGQVLARDDKINVADGAQLIFIARGAVVDDFESEFRMSGLIAAAPFLEISRKFIVGDHVNRFQIRNTREVVHHPFDDRFATHHDQRFCPVERQRIKACGVSRSEN